jgi:hypothetical protein
MAAFNKLNGFVEHRNHGVHNLGSNQLAIALSNTNPSSEATNPNSTTSACVLTNVTQINYGNLSGTNPRNVTTSSSGQTSGTYKLVCQDLTLVANGSVGPFRYVYLFNTQGIGVANPLIGYYDYGSSITLANGETFTIDFDQANGVLSDA